MRQCRTDGFKFQVCGRIAARFPVDPFQKWGSSPSDRRATCSHYEWCPVRRRCRGKSAEQIEWTPTKGAGWIWVRGGRPGAGWLPWWSTAPGARFTKIFTNSKSDKRAFNRSRRVFESQKQAKRGAHRCQSWKWSSTVSVRCLCRRTKSIRVDQSWFSISKSHLHGSGIEWRQSSWAGKAKAQKEKT